MQLEDVRGQIAAATTNSPKGAVNGVRQTFTIFDNDQLLHAKEWEDVIVAYRNGAPVRISDIGKAIDGPADVTQAAWGNGKRDVFLVVFKQPGANVIKTVDKVKQTMTRLEASIPASMHVNVLSDRTTTIRASVNDVQFTLHPDDHPRRLGDLRLPAQLLGDLHPQRHRAARPARRLRADVGAPATASTICR